MNNCTLVGRLGRDPELRATQSGVEYCSFSIAVDRRFKNAAGERESDWINIKCWRQTATFIAQYFKKGMKIGIIGSIQTGSYEKDGRTVYTTDVVADSAYFVESKSSQTESADSASDRSFMGVPIKSADNSELPWDAKSATQELPFDL